MKNMQLIKSHKLMNENEIDIVITWVDNKDPKWIHEYEQYAGTKKDSIRFEELNTLKYIFRGIEKFMPWIRKVHFVTCGHYPLWLNLDHPKLYMVRHEDIFPDTEVLPTFHSRAIEMNFHFINGLSNQFIYFNDDMFVTKELSSKYFFTNNLPNDFFIVQSLFHDDIFSHGLHADMQIINKEIRKDHSFKKLLLNTVTLKYGVKNLVKSFLLMLLSKQIPLFALNHHPQAHLKSNFIEVEESYPDIVKRTRSMRFRTPDAINQYVFRFWGLIKGKYHPKINNDTYYIGVKSLDKLQVTIEELKHDLDPALVCFGEEEGFPIEKYNDYKNILIDYLEGILPEKSSWEIS